MHPRRAVCLWLHDLHAQARWERGCYSTRDVRHAEPAASQTLSHDMDESSFSAAAAHMHASVPTRSVLAPTASFASDAASNHR